MSALATPQIDLTNTEGVQRALNALGFKLFVDGIWGEKTALALKTFQMFNGLAADGMYGKETRAALLRELARG